MMRSGVAALVLATLSTLPTVARATPAAIVESVQALGAGVQALDYVESGRTIDLGTTGTITLGYFASCTQDTVTGGKVTIGERQSTVVDGRLSRNTVACDGGALTLTASLQAQSGVVVMRGAPEKAPAGNPSLGVMTLHVTRPLVRLSEGSKITVTRVDVAEAPITVAAQGTMVDFVDMNVSLKPGATYKLSAEGGRSIEIVVDRGAKSGRQPILSRLVPL